MHGDCKPLTTFVHTNTNAFREVVQRLTGPSETKDHQPTNKVPIATTMKKTTISKLHERRKCMKPKLEIAKPSFQYHNKQQQQTGSCLSPTSNKSRNSSSFPPSPVSGISATSSCSNLLPSTPTTPSTMFSQLTIMEEGQKKQEINIQQDEEEKAIKERRFYLHPSPRSKPNGYNNEPELLILFPLASPNATEKV